MGLLDSEIDVAVCFRAPPAPTSTLTEECDDELDDDDDAENDDGRLKAPTAARIRFVDATGVEAPTSFEQKPKSHFDAASEKGPPAVRSSADVVKEESALARAAARAVGGRGDGDHTDEEVADDES